MELSAKATEIYRQVAGEATKLGDLRKIAKEIKKNHQLGLELWSTGNYFARQLAVLLFDPKLLSPDAVDKLVSDMRDHPMDERLQLIDWLMANQLSKNKNAIALMQSWQNDPEALKRRTFWYYEARLRWVGQKPPSNTEDLLLSISEKIETEVPEVQWAMNFTAAQIGIFQPEYRDRCIKLGERVGLYKDEVVPRGCTPSYLPQHIAVQVAKLKK
ncbi:DNA alkylation repair protein [Flavobacterium selenitireducens]|uniref:DNA alkylation repair protein n=1 Tax=Flavobacterium selenitireducens TaxID=2722704 RepID=UPI00168BD131|nr:DNA alkylation repair protein [Flavobacterium selenitireducens]MBD3583806.1 DNA alkylation repair protein [Flavobacterium selenitireducens]